jgi:hypothetical protein
MDFQWIPAHRGVPGNEAADQAAKQAAAPHNHRQNQGRSWDRPQDNRTGIRTLLTTAKRVINKALQDDWDGTVLSLPLT